MKPSSGKTKIPAQTPTKRPKKTRATGAKPADTAKLSGSSKVGRETLAKVLGVEIRSIANFVVAGMPKAEHGAYPLVSCVHWYIERERDAAKSSRALNDLELARRRKTAAEADLAELDLAAKVGTSLPLELHEQRLRERLEAVAGAIKANGRYHADVKAAITDEQADALLERMADEQLAELHGLKDTIE